MANARWLVVLGLLMLCQACSLSDHPVAQSSLGRPSSFADMEKLIDIPGPIEVETINSADWTVPLAGLLNLKSPAAQAAHLTDHPEPIHIFAHVVRHPQFGTYLVDTGVSQQLLDDPGGQGVSWLVRKVMPPTLELALRRFSRAFREVFRVCSLLICMSTIFRGCPDIPSAVPLYVGRGESTRTSFQNAFVRGTTSKLRQGKADLLEWPFRLDDAHRVLSSAM